MSLYREFIHYRTYAKFNPELGRRATWEEMVNNYFKYFGSKLGDKVTSDPLFQQSKQYVLQQEVMPSMRALWSAGPALDQCNSATYNCAAMNLDCVESFSELLYLLMHGVGVGFSVEQKVIDRLPTVPNFIAQDLTPIIVEDTRKGWAVALKQHLVNLYAGSVRTIDISLVRKKGAKLKTFGGTASGGEVFLELTSFVTTIFFRARGRRLLTAEIHEIACMIAKCVIAGGTRRSATLSMSDLDDTKMRDIKHGNSEWYLYQDHLSYANNSAVYKNKTYSKEDIRTELEALRAGGMGERGIINHDAIVAKVKSLNVNRDTTEGFLVNPCGEAILSDMEFCNLTEVVIKESDSATEDISLKIRCATFIGMMQASMTDFDFLRPEWKMKSERDRLLGVSLTGIQDHPELRGVDANARKLFASYKAMARVTASYYAYKYGIAEPKQITLIKPSGTVSQLVDCASGLHERHSQYYIRNVRIAKVDPLSKVMIDLGINAISEGDNWVLQFPIKSPGVTPPKKTAIEQLEYYLFLNKHYAEGNSSCTITVADDEWAEVIDFVCDNFDKIIGVTFLNKTHSYVNAPFQEISEARYTELMKVFPTDAKIVLNEENYENNNIEFACTGGTCEL